MGFLLITEDIDSSRTFVKSTTYIIKGIRSHSEKC
jgi:hypothetical protein